MPRRAIIALALLPAVALAACESSQDKSARLAKSAGKVAKLTTLKAGAANADVTVAATTVLANKDGGRAVVVELKDSGKPQAGVPILITAEDKAGKPLYKNDLNGLQTSLQQMAYVGKSPPGPPAFWVHDQVVATATPARIDVAVGKSKAPAPGAVPKIVLEGVKLDSDPSGLVATGVVKNLSKTSQRNMPIYAVAQKGGKIVAAGRALIEKLDPEPQKKPTVFRIFFVGNPKGARLDVRAVPSTFTGATP
jgi:hypothetical protein